MNTEELMDTEMQQVDSEKFLDCEIDWVQKHYSHDLEACFPKAWETLLVGPHEMDALKTEEKRDDYHSLATGSWKVALPLLKAVRTLPLQLQTRLED